MLGPIAGGAVVSILAIREAMNYQAEAAKKSADETRKYLEALNSVDTHKMAAEYNELRNEVLELSQGSIWTNAIDAITGAPIMKVWNLMDIGEKQQQMKVLETKMAQIAQGKWPGAGGGTHHIETAVKTESLGVFKLEHSAQNPQVKAVEENTAALKGVEDKLDDLQAAIAAVGIGTLAGLGAY